MRRWIAGLAGLLFLGWSAAPARAAKLAEIKADLTGKESGEMVSLYGDKMTDGNYYQHLLLLVNDRDGKLKTAYKPSLQGGYDPLLKKTAAVKGREELILSVGQGGSAEAMSYRVLNFSKPEKVQETFTGVDNLGVTTSARYLDGRKFIVTCRGSVLQDSVSTDDILHVFDAAGRVQKPYLRPMVTGIVSLTAWDGRIFTSQNIMDADGSTLLGRLYTIWDWEKDKWQPINVQLEAADQREEKDLRQAKVNSDAAAGNWKLFNRRYIQAGVEVNYPEVAVEGDQQLQNKINDQLQKWVHADDHLYQQAYRVDFAGPRMISLVAFKENNQRVIREKIFNINMQTGETLPLKKMFNYQDKDFLPLLNLLGHPQNAVKSLPENWYYNGGTFTFVLPKDEAPTKEVLAAAEKKLAAAEKVLAKAEKNLAVAEKDSAAAEKKSFSAGKDPAAVQIENKLTADKVLSEKLAAKKAYLKKMSRKKQPLPVSAPDGSFVKSEPQLVSIGAGYLVKFVIQKNLPASH